MEELVEIKSTEEERYLFLSLLEELISDISVTFIFENGNTVTVGKRSVNNKYNDVTIQVNEPGFFDAVLVDGNLGLGEAYIRGDFEVIEGDLEDFLLALLIADIPSKVKGNVAAVFKVLTIRLRNIFRGRYKNVQSHYDTGELLFRTFLDNTMAYSCGYKISTDDTLNKLQKNKYERICQKLRLSPGNKLLDIGCGYAGLLIHAATNYGVKGTGITISKQHCELAREEVSKAGLDDRIQIQYASHKDIDGRYDRVVSVGMMEHLMRSDYHVYIKNIAKVLSDDGFGLIHTIGCNTSKNKHDPYIQKYIFPGSGQPRLSEIAEQLETHGLPILDVENIVRHYAPTVKCWKENLINNWDILEESGYDETFKRMYIYYFSCGIAAALASESAVYQVLFARDSKTYIPYQRI